MLAERKVAIAEGPIGTIDNGTAVDVLVEKDFTVLNAVAKIFDRLGRREGLVKRVEEKERTLALTKR